MLTGKIIPGKPAISAEAATRYRMALTKSVSENLLARFGLDKFVKGLPAFKAPTAKEIRAELDENPDKSWRDIVEEAVEEQIEELNLAKRVEKWKP